MSSKKCIYRDCTSTGKTGEPTLFAFPKDAARRTLWLQMAGRPGYTLQKSDCLCELHFGRQYISSNQRRKVLVGLSLPKPYNQDQENDDEHQIEALDEHQIECERLDMCDMFAEDNPQPEDVHSLSSNSVIEHVDDYEPEMIVCDESAVNNDKLKRKITEHSPQNGTSSKPLKLIKVDLNKTKPKNGVETTQRPHIKDTAKQKSVPTTIDHPDVSTFYIRGEEFIQMPTSLYLAEKSKLESSHMESYVQEITELREELNKYKNAVEIIKARLATLP